MSVGDADIAFALELFEGLGALTHRKMFGGMCIYRDGVVFALVSSEGRVYLKAKGHLADELRDGGSEQFHSMPYWSMPDATLEDPEAATEMARRTLQTL